jgi:hypothetical protein
MIWYLIFISLHLWYQEYAHNHFMAKHQQAASQQWRNFDYFRMDVIRFNLIFLATDIAVCLYSNAIFAKVTYIS